MTDPAELLDVARTLATEVGRFIVAGRSEARVTQTKSSSVDIVTQMDIAAETMLRERLAELRPGDGLYGEEGSAIASSTGVTWIVDPIDGTVNYLYGIPHFGVSVAAVTGDPAPAAWEAQAGAVYTGSGELFSAGRGLGAFRGDARLRVDGGPVLAQTLVATGFQYTAERRALQGALVARMLPQVRDIRRLGSCAIDLCHAAAGVVDAYYEHGLNPWDFAAGALVAQEAGLTVQGLDGGRPDTFLLIAAPGATFPALRDALAEAGAGQMWETPGA